MDPVNILLFPQLLESERPLLVALRWQVGSGQSGCPRRPGVPSHLVKPGAVPGLNADSSPCQRVVLVIRESGPRRVHSRLVVFLGATH